MAADAATGSVPACPGSSAVTNSEEVARAAAKRCRVAGVRLVIRQAADIRRSAHSIAVPNWHSDNPSAVFSWIQTGFVERRVGGVARGIDSHAGQDVLGGGVFEPAAPVGDQLSARDRHRLLVGVFAVADLDLVVEHVLEVGPPFALLTTRHPVHRVSHLLPVAECCVVGVRRHGVCVPFGGKPARTWRRVAAQGDIVDHEMVDRLPDGRFDERERGGARDDPVEGAVGRGEQALLFGGGALAPATSDTAGRGRVESCPKVITERPRLALRAGRNSASPSLRALESAPVFVRAALG